ncbi:hypothetical protein O181_084491 [Austropuccinia psidii MF-1]|uniref:Uncharacterized protein n=1 Tax=Austropuccinia psidii MF-1 TaxID=1389203 RepID=A0A9Q3FWM4_9BASI|nr:hypothetical protein [Austropuccinia psidii MF-1]
MVHGGPWPEMGPTCSMAILVSKGLRAKIGSGGSNCDLGPTWPWELDDFPLLDSLAYGPWTVNYSPQAVEAIAGLNGPKRPFRPKPPNERGRPKMEDDG